MTIELVGDWRQATRRLAASILPDVGACVSVAELYEKLPRPVRSAYANHTLEPDVIFRHPRCDHLLASEGDLYSRPRGDRIVRECRECKREEKRGPTAEQVRQERLAIARKKSPAQS